jgi:hypothetical protein
MKRLSFLLVTVAAFLASQVALEPSPNAGQRRTG